MRPWPPVIDPAPHALASISAGAWRVDRLFLFLLAISGAMVFILALLVVGYCIRYHKASPADRTGARSNATGVEIAWFAVTLLVFLGLCAWANTDYLAARTPPAEARVVYVLGKQWMWKFEHPAGRREIDELHVPTGEPIRLVLTSNDAIHSFFVPALRIKQDAVPGRYTSLWFNADEPGEYHLFCAQYCGDEHASMIGRLVAMPPGDFSAWLSGRPTDAASRPAPEPPPEAMHQRGSALFHSLGCAVCHSASSELLAPRLDGIWGRQTRLVSDRLVTVDENYIRESILEPNAAIVAGYASPSLMPAYAGRLSEEQLANIIEYIRSISHGAPPEAAP